uniref:Uncharacterized protein n=1 Tax=Amphimedon queenslandica TaxID=400682 RepID=A0A1X7T868_AMPQE
NYHVFSCSKNSTNVLYYRSSVLSQFKQYFLSY